MPTRITLTCTHPGKCPVFIAGDRMVVSFPWVRRDESDAICAYALVTYLGAYMKGATRGMKEFICPAVNCNGVFRVEEATGLTGQLSRVAVLPEDLSASSFSNALTRSPFFAALPQESLVQFSGRLQFARFAPKDTILKEGTTGNYFYMVLSGTVEVIQSDRAGTERVVAALGENACFGEMSLLTGEPCSATVRAVEEVLCATLSRKEFDRILDENPRLNRYFTRLLATRLRETNRQIFDELDQGVVGKLSMITLPELAQMVASSGRSGTLWLFHRDRKGSSIFGNGKIRGVYCGAKTGTEAFYEMMTWKDGTFRFEPAPLDVGEETKALDTMGLLLEGFRRIDESGTIPADQAPPASTDAFGGLDPTKDLQPPG